MDASSSPSPTEPTSSTSPSTAAPPVSGQGTATATAIEDRLWRARNLQPMPVRALPKARRSIHLLGRTVLRVALGVGMGES